MNFIFGLQKTIGQHDTNMVVVDKLSKATHFVAIKCIHTTSDITQVFIKETVRLHEVPIKIISTRDAKFTSKICK